MLRSSLGQPKSIAVRAALTYERSILMLIIRGGRENLGLEIVCDWNLGPNDKWAGVQSASLLRAGKSPVVIKESCSHDLSRRPAVGLHACVYHGPVGQFGNLPGIV